MLRKPCSDFSIEKAPWVFTRSGGYLLMGRQGASWQLCPVGAGHWALLCWAWNCGPEPPITLGACVSESLCCRAKWYLLIPEDRADCVTVGDKGRGAGEQHVGGRVEGRGEQPVTCSLGSMVPQLIQLPKGALVDPRSLAMHQLLHRSHEAQRPTGPASMGRLRGCGEEARGLGPAHQVLDLARAGKRLPLGFGEQLRLPHVHPLYFLFTHYGPLGVLGSARPVWRGS